MKIDRHRIKHEVRGVRMYCELFLSSMKEDDRPKDIVEFISELGEFEKVLDDTDDEKVLDETKSIAHRMNHILAKHGKDGKLKCNE